MTDSITQQKNIFGEVLYLHQAIVDLKVISPNLVLSRKFDERGEVWSRMGIYV